MEFKDWAQVAPKGNMIKISADHLGWLLLCSMRYAIGRRTYAPSMTCDIIREHWKKLQQKDRDLLQRDLKEQVLYADKYDPERGIAGKWLGSACDEKTWRDMLVWMEEKWVTTQ